MDLSKAKPREVEAYLRQVILKVFGDVVENAATITASHGYYDVSFDTGGEFYSFQNFRKGNAEKIAKAIRALK